MRFLLDTNVISEAARPVPHPEVLARLTEAAGVAAMAAPTWHELRYGVDRLDPGHRRSALGVFLMGLPSRYPVLPYDMRAAEWHAKERARLEVLGLTTSFVDGQIAATAVTNGAVLVTRNVSDFGDFVGLEVESWWDV